MVQNLSCAIKKKKIIPLAPITVGEAYIDFTETELCDLYHDTPHFDTDIGEIVGLRYITTVLVPYQPDRAYYSGFDIAEDLSLYSSQNIKDIVSGHVANTNGAEYVVRSNNRGYALSTASGSIYVNSTAVIHAFVFCLFSAPTNYTYIFDVGGEFQVRVMSDLSIQVSKDFFSTFSVVPIQPLELNKEYIIKINYIDGVYLNSYKILDGYDDAQTNTYSLDMKSFGGVSFDSGNDNMDGYICNYKMYAGSVYYYYNYISFLDNLLGFTVHKKLFDLSNDFKNRIETPPTYPLTKNVLCKYKTMPDVPSVKIIHNNVAYVGDVHVNTVVNTYPATLTITQNFLKPPKNTYVLVTTTTMSVKSLSKVCDFVTPLSTTMLMRPISASIGIAGVPICIGIDDIRFKYGLTLSSSTIVDTFISEDVTMIDGTTSVSILPKPSFSNQAVLYSDGDNYEHYDIITNIKNTINDMLHVMYFSDGSSITFKYDLLVKPLELTPIYEGSEYFKLKLRILKWYEMNLFQWQ